jgi:hypothetical protein
MPRSSAARPTFAKSRVIGDEQVLRHARAATRFHARAYIGARHGFATACVPGAVTNHGSISVEIVAASLIHG